MSIYLVQKVQLHIAVYFCIVASFHLACIAITVIEILSILPEWL